MLERYRRYVQDHPLQWWMIIVVVLLALLRSLPWARHDPLFAVGLAFANPTAMLMVRLSEQGRRERPISAGHERAISALALTAGVIGVGALVVEIFGRRAGWPVDMRVVWMVGSGVAAAVGAALGNGTRQTQAGRVAVWIGAVYVVLLIVSIILVLSRHAVGHA